MSTLDIVPSESLATREVYNNDAFVSIGLTGLGHDISAYNIHFIPLDGGRSDHLLSGKRATQIEGIIEQSQRPNANLFEVSNLLREQLLLASIEFEDEVYDSWGFDENSLTNLREQQELGFAPKLKVLDVGIGKGVPASRLIDRLKITGIDFSYTAVELSERNFQMARKNLSNIEGIGYYINSQGYRQDLEEGSTPQISIVNADIFEFIESLTDTRETFNNINFLESLPHMNRPQIMEAILRLVGKNSDARINLTEFAAEWPGMILLKLMAPISQAMNEYAATPFSYPDYKKLIKKINNTNPDFTFSIATHHPMKDSIKTSQVAVSNNFKILQELFRRYTHRPELVKMLGQHGFNWTMLGKMWPDYFSLSLNVTPKGIPVEA